MSRILNSNIPWVESDLFHFFSKFRQKKTKKIAKFFHDNGYVIVDLKLSKNYINKTIMDIKKLAYDSSSKKIQNIIIIMKIQELLKVLKNLNL